MGILLACPISCTVQPSSLTGPLHVDPISQRLVQPCSNPFRALGHQPWKRAPLHRHWHEQPPGRGPGGLPSPSFLLSSISANKPILIICQSRPRTRWGFPSLKSSAPMLTTWHPMAEAEFKAKFRFSCKRRSLLTGSRLQSSGYEIQVSSR